MAFTKLFKRDHDPYSLKGRWYKIHCTSDGTNITADDSQSDISSSVASGSTTLRLREYGNFSVVDYVVDFVSVTGSTSNFVKSLYLLGNGGQYGLTLPSAARFNELDVYVYIVNK